MEIAVLGTGVMGLPMARNIAGSGQAVRAWNRSREKAEPLSEHGVRVADDPAGAAEGADVVVTMLTDGDATAEVARQFLPALGAGGVWWQCGTVGLDATAELAALAAEHEVAFVDGPVSGTRKPAEDGTLVILASGSADAKERCAPLFDATGAKVVDAGERPGDAMRLKLLLNHWLGTLTAALGDTVALARALDVEPQRFLDAIAGGPLDSGFAQMKGKLMVEGSFDPPSFALRHAAKDLRLAVAAAGAADLELAVAPAALARYDAADAAGHGGEDLAAVVLAAG